MNWTPELRQRLEANRELQWFPTSLEYTLAYPCPTCKAEPGQDCDAPRKRARHQQYVDNVRQAGMEPQEPDRLNMQHSTRIDRAWGHQSRDQGDAPWMEERIPGVRYDTIRRGIEVHSPTLDAIGARREA